MRNSVTVGDYGTASKHFGFLFFFFFPPLVAEELCTLHAGQMQQQQKKKRGWGKQRLCPSQLPLKGKYLTRMCLACWKKTKKTTCARSINKHCAVLDLKVWLGRKHSSTKEEINLSFAPRLEEGQHDFVRG